MSEKHRPPRPFERKIKWVVTHLDKKYWNSFNLILSFFSPPQIGSPIHFSEPYVGLMMCEYIISEMPKYIYDRFISFCYPAGMHDRDKEIEIDKKHYWPFAKVLIVFCGNEIVSCALYLIRDKNMHLPLEYGLIKTEDSNKKYFNVEKDIGNKSSAEIYRLRRSFTIERHLIIPVVEMIFRAVWAKTIQAGIECFYCTCDEDNKELIHLYQKTLLFDDTGKRVYYENVNENYIVFRKDSYKHEFDFASKSLKHFMLQLSFRRNLAQIVFKKYPSKMLNLIIEMRKIIYHILLKLKSNPQVYPLHQTAS